MAESTWTDAKELFREIDVALLPVGSTEQHGPQNPLGTDHLQAAALSRIVGERTGVPVLPVIPVGVSESHRSFSGTLWVPQSVLRDYVRAIVLSVAAHGARKIVIMNGHSENKPAIMEVARELRREHGILVLHLMAYPPEGMVSPGHADAIETSINLYLFRHLVKKERAIETRVKAKLGPFQIKGINCIGPAEFAWDASDLTESGIFGPAGETIVPGTASEEAGKKLIDPFIEEVCKFIEMLKMTNVGELLGKAQ